MTFGFALFPLLPYLVVMKYSGVQSAILFKNIKNRDAFPVSL